MSPVTYSRWQVVLCNTTGLHPMRPEHCSVICVINEVVSDSTRRTDEYEKREAYLSIDSLCDYVLIEQNAALALVYRRADSGFDREVVQGADSVIALPEIGCQLALEDVYQNVEFQPADPDDEA